LPLGEHAAGEAEISAQESTGVARFTAKLFCDVEFWVERLPKLIEAQPEFERAVADGQSPVRQPRPSDST
jgi:hypothetical protein